MNRLMFSIAWLLPLVFIGQLAVTEATQPESNDSNLVVADHLYVGASKCKTCHRKPETGEQFPKWEASAHAQAFATLGTPEAKAIAAEKGLGDPQTEATCLKCHVTAYDVAAELLDKSYDMAEGVSCESCHGPGKDYRKKKVMIEILLGTTDGATLGLITPDEATCTGCHNEESPSFAGFDFEARMADIAHPIPQAQKDSHK